MQKRANWFKIFWVGRRSKKLPQSRRYVDLLFNVVEFSHLRTQAGDGAKETTTGKTSTGIKLGRLRKTG